MGSPAQNQIVIGPQPGPQAALVTCPANEILYGGARGGGKSHGMLLDFWQQNKKYGKYARGFLSRESYPELEDMIEKANTIFPLLGAKWKASARTWVFQEGGQLKFRHLQSEKEAAIYQGHEYTWFGFDEAGKLPSMGVIDTMRGTLRSPHGVPPRMVLSANPGGRLHNALKARYVDPAEPRTLIREVEPETGLAWTRVFIPALVTDNPVLMQADPGYIQRIKDACKGKPWLLKAWLDGLWDIVAGGALDDVWSDRLKVPRFKVPRGWRITRSFDWGSSHPFSVGWWATANGEEATMPDGTKFNPVAGSLIRIHEWYGTQAPGSNEGLRLSSAKIADGIKEREAALSAGGWIVGKVRPGPADNQINNVTEADVDTIAKKMADKGVEWERSDKSPGSRKVGLQVLRDRMDSVTEGEGPGIYFMDHCRAAISQLPTVTRDEDDPEDAAKGGEDHVYDEVRYAVLHADNRALKSLKVQMPR